MLKDKILKLLEDNCLLTHEQIATMVDTDVDTVNNIVEEAKKEGTLLGYRAQINWDNSNIKETTAIIELKITPQQGKGFDAVAERICQYPQVESLFLLSGGFDMLVTVRDKSLRDVALFVSGTLATIDGVTSTATHFILKRYKDNGTIFVNKNDDNRQVIS
ncbi:MAG: Lrp/AsnC family transcriptional regulator [Monoglobales bacterium]